MRIDHYLAKAEKHVEAKRVHLAGVAVALIAHSDDLVERSHRAGAYKALALAVYDRITALDRRH